MDLLPSEVGVNFDNLKFQFVFKMKNGIFTVYRSKEGTLIPVTTYIAVVLCSYDQDTPAVISCPECNKRFCAECDRVLHKDPTKSKHVRTSFRSQDPVFPVISWKEFVLDYRRLEQLRTDGACYSFASKRLRLLELKYQIHTIMNDKFEKEAMKVIWAGVVCLCLHSAATQIGKK